MPSSTQAPQQRYREGLAAVSSDLPSSWAFSCHTARIISGNIASGRLACILAFLFFLLCFGVLTHLTDDGETGLLQTKVSPILNISVLTFADHKLAFPISLSAEG